MRSNAGEFDDLRGVGKRLDLGAYFETREELRLAFSITRNAGFLRQEAELTQQIGEIQEQTRLAARRPSISLPPEDSGACSLSSVC
jgi:hypothetical protein